MVSITDIVQQYTEMRQGLKQLKLELELYWPNPKDIKIEEKDTNLITKDKEINDMVEHSKDTEDTEDNSIKSHNDIEHESSVTLGEDIENTSYSKHGSDAKSSSNTVYKEHNPEYDIKHTVNTDPNEDCVNNNERVIDSNIKTSMVEQENTAINRDRFMQVMEEYCESANDRFEELEALYVNVDFKWRDIMKYYGENPKHMKPDEFFHIFSRFIKSWKIAAAEELKYTEGMEYEERRKQDSEEKRKALLMPATENSDSDSHTTGGEYNDRRIMDNLMEQLRSGKGENKMRQRRVRERLRRIKNEEERIKKEQDIIKPIVERRRAAPLSVIISRRNSVSSTGSSEQMPAISAEDLLRRLQQENE